MSEGLWGSDARAWAISSVRGALLFAKLCGYRAHGSRPGPSHLEASCSPCSSHALMNTV